MTHLFEQEDFHAHTSTRTPWVRHAFTARKKLECAFSSFPSPVASTTVVENLGLEAASRATIISGACRKPCMRKTKVIRVREM